MTTQRPLGKIRTTRPRTNAGALLEAAGIGRHRRPANPDGNRTPTQLRANRGESGRDNA